MREPPQRLGRVLEAALARLPYAAELADYGVWSHWEATLGPMLARHAHPVRLRRGVLVVRVDSPEWMHELQFVKHQIRDRLNARLGRRAVRELFLALAMEP